MKKQNMAELELRGDRLILSHKLFGLYSEFDVTPLWHFFNEVNEFRNTPQLPEQQTGNVTEQMSKDL